MADYDWFRSYEDGYEVTIKFFFAKSPRRKYVIDEALVRFLVTEALENDNKVDKVLDPRHIEVEGFKQVRK